MSSSSTTPSNDAQSNPVARWQEYSSACKTDVTIKIIAVVLIALLNMAAICTLFYYLVSYTPIPTQALITSPFIVGVIAALSNLHVPTFGISERSYMNYTNPLSLIGRVASYILFGPLKYAVDRVDLKFYHDPICACEISDYLADEENKHTFADVVDRFGRHYDHLILYGFIHKKHEHDLEKLFENYEIQKMQLEVYKGVVSKTAEANQKIKALSRQWKELKDTFKEELPHPDTLMPKYDLSKWQDRCIVEVRKFFGINGQPPTFVELKA